MGWNYLLGCDECKENIIIGQDGAPLWIGEELIMRELSAFLCKHERHRLSYCDEHAFEDSGWTTVKWPHQNAAHKEG